MEVYDEVRLSECHEGDIVVYHGNYWHAITTTREEWFVPGLQRIPDGRVWDPPGNPLVYVVMSFEDNPILCKER